MTLAAEAAAFLAARRKPAERHPSGFRIERRPIQPKPASARPIRSAPHSGPSRPALLPIAADLARILADPRGFPRGLM